nr:uncharacterized protein LOC125423239 [Ziziphus jujuba var. spinosa]
METDNYIFFHCQTARAIWFATPWSIKWDHLVDMPLEETLALLFDPKGVLPVHNNDREEFFLYATLVLDQISKIRNQAVFENTTFSLQVTMDKMRTRFQETRNAACKHSMEFPISSLNFPTGEQSPSQCIRINTDAAVKGGQSMIGIVARNQQKEILKIQAVKCFSDLPEVAEAFGILQGLKLAKEEGWTHIWCESDARNIVTNINSQVDQTCHWAAAGILSDIIHLKGEFEEAHLLWIPRDKNFLAHFVSNWAINNGTVAFCLCTLFPVPFPFLQARSEASANSSAGCICGFFGL